MTPRTHTPSPAVLPPSGRLPGMPALAYAPSDLAGDWVFLLHTGLGNVRLRKTDLQALYRDCDAALNDERKAAH